jgi:hypothetical protein
MMPMTISISMSENARRVKKGRIAGSGLAGLNSYTRISDGVNGSGCQVSQFISSSVSGTHIAQPAVNGTKV